MTLTDIALTTLDGAPSTLAQYLKGAMLVVNVASKCGLTPQYAGLEKLQESTATVASPSSASRATSSGPGARHREEIQTFCTKAYGVTFPMFAKIDVNGAERHPLYAELTTRPTARASR